MKHTKIIFAIGWRDCSPSPFNFAAAGDGEKKATLIAKQQRGDKVQKGQRGGMAAMMKELRITKEQEAAQGSTGKIRNASDKRALNSSKPKLKEILTQNTLKKMELCAKQGGKGKLWKAARRRNANSRTKLHQVHYAKRSSATASVFFNQLNLKTDTETDPVEIHLFSAL